MPGKKFKIYIIILCSLFNCYKLYSQADSVNLTISSAKKKDSSDQGKKNVEIVITSKCSQTVNVPSLSFLTIVESEAAMKVDSNADGFFEVLTISSTGKDSVVSPTNDCDKLSPTDTTGKIVKLLKGQSISYGTFPCFYYLVHGHIYRVRFYFRFSKYNSLHDLYSNWITINY